MRRCAILALIGMLFALPVIRAQETDKTVSGKVVDDKGVELVGVNVMVKGTNIGVATDVNGRYVLKIRSSVADPVIVFSFLGMQTQEIKPAAATVDVVLKEDPNSIENAVVTGYATIRKESFTGTATTVSREELLKVSPNNVMKSLSVFDPSLRLAVNNEMGSDANTMPEYYIRGRSGVSDITQLD